MKEGAGGCGPPAATAVVACSHQARTQGTRVNTRSDEIRKRCVSPFRAISGNGACSRTEADEK